mmetsp:Transcript_2054/g.4694  ORF Transcript_2054/g.4694 Transcript_2054/m.4694 type:complete len:127 (+) Transcript_2054:400-780(+)
MSWQGYRESKLGDALVESLDRFISDARLNPDQALVMLSLFDKVVAKHLGASDVRAQLKGALHTYRSYDEVYTLIVEGAEIVFSKGTKEKSLVTSPMIKIVCQDAKVGQRNPHANEKKKKKKQPANA